MTKKNAPPAEDDAIQLDDDPKERMKKVWFRAYESDIAAWIKAAQESEASSTSAWLRDVANRASRK